MPTVHNNVIGQRFSPELLDFAKYLANQLWNDYPNGNLRYNDGALDKAFNLWSEYFTSSGKFPHYWNREYYCWVDEVPAIKSKTEETKRYLGKYIWIQHNNGMMDLIEILAEKNNELLYRYWGASKIRSRRFKENELIKIEQPDNN